MYPEVTEECQQASCNLIVAVLIQADRCVTCLCQEGWDGDLRGQFCSRVKCDLSLAGDKLVRGCKPLYREGVCCNTDWVCPEDVQPVSLSLFSNGILIISFTGKANGLYKVIH